MQLFKRVLLPFLWGKGTFSVPSLGETGEGFHNVELCVFEITDPLYLPLKRGGPVCPHLEGPRNVLLKKYCKTLFINLFRKQANCLSLFGGTEKVKSTFRLKVNDG